MVLCISRMKKLFVLMGFVTCLTVAVGSGEVVMKAGLGTLNFSGGEGAGKGKHVVLLAGDEEYRSEIVMPMMARILAEKHGFETTVLFSADEDGTINPKANHNLMGAEALDSADALVIFLRFRSWDDATMEKFKAAVDRGVPVVAIRTSTHVFNFPAESKWVDWSWKHPTGGFGKQVLGETWISHWGVHKKEATRAILEPGQEKNPLLNGVSQIFGDTDVYEAAPPEDAVILLRGIVLKGMKTDDEPADYEKKTRAGVVQKVNEPTMPVAWSREVKNAAGTTNKVLTTTMGAATDFADESLRRLVINGVYWGLGLEVPEKADASIIGEYEEAMYGFDGHKKGMQAADFAK